MKRKGVIVFASYLEENLNTCERKVGCHEFCRNIQSAFRSCSTRNFNVVEEGNIIRRRNRQPF